MSPDPVTVATLLTDEVRLPLTWPSHYPEIGWSHCQSFGLQGSILLAIRVTLNSAGANCHAVNTCTSDDKDVHVAFASAARSDVCMEVASVYGKPVIVGILEFANSFRNNFTQMMGLCCGVRRAWNLSHLNLKTKPHACLLRTERNACLVLIIAVWCFPKSSKCFGLKVYMKF